MENNTSLQQQLLEAGVHFGHLKKKWNPKMLPYIFAEKKGIHIIDLNKTTESLQEAASALKQMARAGKKIMFVGTKHAAREAVQQEAIRCGMGLSILPRQAVGYDMQPGLTTLDVVDFPLVAHWHVVYPVGKQLSVVTQSFVDFLRKQVSAVS